MKLITAFTSDPVQNITLILDDGGKISFSMRYISNELGWFFSMNYGSFTFNNRRMVTGPNIIRAFRGFLPFGLAIVATDGLEPIYLDDFISGRIKMYLLNQDDVVGVEALITAY